VRVLLIEDDDTAEERLRSELKVAGVTPAITRALSRDGAKLEIDGGNFDLIVCDLRIPTLDRGYDASEEHGLAVLDYARDRSPGTPILVLSGVATLKHLSDFLSSGKVGDFFGGGTTFRMASEAGKDDYAKVAASVAALNSELSALDQIELSYGTQDISLSAEARRVLRIFARRQGGLSIEIAPLSGGLSGDKVLRCRVRANVGVVASVAVRIAAISDCEDEVERYRRYVAPLLPPGTYAPHADLVAGGAGREGGTYYKLAEEFDRSLFDVLQASDAKAAALVPILRAMQDSWRMEEGTTVTRVRDIRRSLAPDEFVESISDELKDLAWREFEAEALPVRTACQHGDLHGANVLVDEKDRVLVIDYGRVGRNTTALDPVTLELSAIFHPSVRDIRGDWPTEAQAHQWDDLAAYLEGCRHREFIAACREWAFRESGDKAVFATVYSFAVRQLRFAGTDRTLAQGLAAGAMRAFYER